MPWGHLFPVTIDRNSQHGLFHFHLSLCTMLVPIHDDQSTSRINYRRYYPPTANLIANQNEGLLWILRSFRTCSFFSLYFFSIKIDGEFFLRRTVLLELFKNIEINKDASINEKTFQV